MQRLAVRTLLGAANSDLVLVAFLHSISSVITFYRVRKLTGSFVHVQLVWESLGSGYCSSLSSVLGALRYLAHLGDHLFRNLLNKFKV
jgi:hypothetical protein